MADEGQAQGGMPEGQGGMPELMSFDTWIATQDDAVKTLLEARDAPLRNALQQERENAKGLAKQIRELSGKLDQNSDAAKQLTELSGKLETEQKRADFYEAATAAGCRNLRLAWLAASVDGLTLEQVRTQHPDLFGATRPATNAGNGAQQAQTGAAQGMNAFIRKADPKVSSGG